MNEARTFAVLLSGYLAVQMLVSWRWQLLYFRVSRRIERPTRLLALWDMPALSERQFQTAGALLVVGCAIGISGWRAGFVLAAAACLAYFSQILLLDTVQRKVNVLPMLLVLFAVMPATASAWSSPADPWAAATAKLLIALVYVSAGLMKLRRSGLRWVDGRAVQAYLLAADLRYDVPRARTLATHRPLCALLSGFVLAFELFGWMILFAPAGGYVFAALGLAMHAGTFAYMRVNYLKYFGPVYFVFAAPLLTAAAARLVGMA